MRTTIQNTRRVIALSAMAIALPFTTTAAQADNNGYKNNGKVTIYFTRHAEKKTTTESLGTATNTYDVSYNGSADQFIIPRNNEEVSEKGKVRDDVCGITKCAEELSELGLVRRELLADWFNARGITGKLDAVYSSHKVRTYQTVETIAFQASKTIIQLPSDASELNPEGTTASECLTLDAIRATPPGDTILIAGHSGTLYDIMGDGNSDCAGLGLLTDADPSSDRFPKDGGKVANFGDIWKVTLKNGVAKFVYRKNLQPARLRVLETVR